MGRFAIHSEVPVERSRAEIEETLRKYGASEFHSGWKADAAMIDFRLGELFIRFVLPFPAKNDPKFTHKIVRGYKKPMSELQRERAYEQELRSRWRALLLVIRAKLEAVECRISTLESEFLAFIVTGSGQTIGEWVMDKGRLGLLTAGAALAIEGPKESPSGDCTVIDAEFEESKPKE